MLCLSYCQILQATHYYVASTGDNSNTGTLASPFRTIQHAADIMTAGDTCYIRAGVYRESVYPVASGTLNSKIVFMPYNNESVTISGCDIISGWQPHSGHIKKAPTNFTLEAENHDDMNGVIIASSTIGYTDNNDWIMFNDVDFETGCTLLTACLGVPDSYAGQTVEIRLGSETGTLIGSLVTTSTGSWSTHEEQTTALTGASGIHDVYIVFKGTSGIGDFDWFKFEN